MPEVSSTNPGKKQLFFHIRLQSIRFPVPPSSQARGGGVFTESARPAWSSLLGAQPVGGTAVHLSSDEGKWMSGVSSAAASKDEAAESPSPQQTAGGIRCVPAAVDDSCSIWESLVIDGRIRLAILGKPSPLSCPSNTDDGIRKLKR